MDNARAAWLLSRVLPAVLSVWLSLGDAGALVDRAEAAEARGDYAAALEAYDAARAEPASPRAAEAEARARFLRDRSEGGFAPLAALVRARREAHDLDALVAAAEGFPPGLVRTEAWMLAAEAYAHRLGRPEDALALWRRAARDGADPVLRAKAASSVTSLDLELHRWADATKDAELGDDRLRRQVGRVVRRRSMHLASIAVLAVTALAATVAIARRRRRPPLAFALGFSAYVGLGGAVLASHYEAGTGRPFLLFGLALAAILVLARAWSLAGGPRGRALRGALCAASVLGAAFLVLEHVDVAYLEGLGL